MSKSSRPMPAPSAVIRVPIWSEPSILSKRARSTLRILPRSGSTAWFSRLRACLAEPPAESPSTRNISDLAGSRSWQSASLPGREEMSSALLRRVSSRALRAASRAAAASAIFCTISRPRPGCSSNQVASPSPTRPSTAGRTSDETSLSLVWRRELGVRHLDRQHAGQALAGVLAGDGDLLALGRAGALGVAGDHPGQGAAEGRQVGAAIPLRDVVGEAQHVLVVAVVPPQRQVDIHLLALGRGPRSAALISGVLALSRWRTNASTPPS